MIRSATLIALGIIFSTSSYSSTELHVFGDSLSDQGHAPIFASGELVKAGATFTNKTTGKPGKVWISYFSSLIKVDEPQPRSPIWEKYYGVDNIEATGFAVAGYTTDDIYSSIVDKGHYQELSKSGLRGSSVFYSKQYFTVNDGYFHTEVSRKPDHVIATLWGGGNDLLKGGDPVRAADTLMKSVKALYDRDNINSTASATRKSWSSSAAGTSSRRMPSAWWSGRAAARAGCPSPTCGSPWPWPGAAGRRVSRPAASGARACWSGWRRCRSWPAASVRPTRRRRTRRHDDHADAARPGGRNPALAPPGRPPGRRGGERAPLGGAGSCPLGVRPHRAG